MKRAILALLTVAALAAIAAVGDVDARTIRRYTMFGGGNVDSTEQLSAWVPVDGASRIYIRTWTTKAAFHASTDADSTFSDSLITFDVQFSDSVSAFVTGPAGLTIAVASDSAVTPVTIAPDTALTLTGVIGRPINKILRGPATGSGRIALVYPVAANPTGTADAIVPDDAGIIAKSYMRVRCTPLRRMTVTGSQSTAGKRVNGLKGLRMQAIVVKD